MKKIKISIEDENGGASLLIHQDATLKEWIEAFCRLLIYAGFQQEAISKHIKHLRWIPAGKHR
jgi:hypothetical protein